MTTTERLAAGQTPFLLEPEQRPMSNETLTMSSCIYEGPTENMVVTKLKNPDGLVVAKFYDNEELASFIASLNGAEPIVEELWEEYKEFIGRRDYCINEEGKKLDGWDYFNERALRKLRRLDGLRCLGWRGEV